MSERPTETGLRRRPWRRFRDLPIWSKLGLIMIVPTLATIVVGTNGLVGHLDTRSGADRARVLANLSETTGDLVHHLQEERAAAVLLLGSSNSDLADQRADTYAEAQRAVDQVERLFQSQSVSLTDVPTSFRQLRDDTHGQLSLLPRARNQITAGSFGLTDAIATYERLIGNLINLRDSSAQFAGEIEIGNRMRAATAIAQAKEHLSQQRVVGHEVLIRGAYHPQLRSAFIGARTGYEQALQTFAAVATAEEQAMLDQALEGPDVRQSQLYQDYLDSLEGTALIDPPWDDEAWDAVMAAHASLLRGVEADLDSVIAAEAAATRNAVERRVLVETGALLVMLVLAILLAWLVARSMARSLRDLRRGALAVAQYGLPQAVARLRDPSLATQLSPAQVASQIAEPLPVRSRDEFGQVAEAFNAVHLEAVRTAAEQAQLRSSVSTMFVNLARRSQILVDRLINHLDRLERGEEDPDRLAELFQLDHLATRMRRNDENLLVLAGADSTRVQREPAPLIDVLRAAQSEVEHYTRIEFGMVDRDLEIAAHAVNDLVHLVAELLDNATEFSPPDSPVMVEARRVGDRAVLYVEDRGLGLSAEQLADINERLATPPLVDVAVSRMMGLVVVARLAARHGVKVELRPASERGTIADVTLPASVLVPRVIGDRVGGRFGQPVERLALESGPSAAPTIAGSTVASALASRSLAARPPAAAPPPLSPSPPLGAPPPLSAPAAAPAPHPPPPFSPPSFTQHPPPPFSPPRFAQPAGADSSDAPFPVSPAPAGAEATGAPTVNGPRPGRPMPAWSDLTGATSRNGAETAAGQTASSGAPAPLPKRRPGGSLNGGTAAEPGRPLETAPLPRPASMTPDPPDPAGRDRSTTGPATPPPQWPPVEPAAATPVPTEAAADPARPPAGSSEPVATAEPVGATAPAVVETMELPIFREVESAWFRTRRPADRPAAAPTADSVTTELATITSSGGQPGATASEQVDPTAGTGAEATDRTDAAGAMGDAMRGDTVREVSGVGGPAGPGWNTAADEGWHAATSAAEVPVQERTAAGLPKRRPMAQLVPGGVEKSSAVSQRRSPEAVRGLLSAYHRGVQRGREQTVGDGFDSSVTPSMEPGKERGT